MVSCDHDKFLHKSLMDLARRHDPDVRESNDDKIKELYSCEKTVLMFEIDLHEVEHKFGGNAGLNLKFIALE